MAVTRARRALAWAAGLAALVATLAYLRDPPWLVQVTSGFSTWREDESGRRYRWTTRSRASLYVPSSAAQVTLPLRLGMPRPDGAPVEAALAVDDRVFARVLLEDPLRWVPVTFAMPARRHTRRAVRMEVVVPRLLRKENLGVQVGEAAIRPGR